MFGKKFRYGAGFGFVIVSAIAIIVIINLIFSLVVDRYPSMKIDLTPEKYYELSQETIDVISNLDREIEVYYVQNSAQELSSIDTLVIDTLERYVSKSNGKMKFETVDPVRNPTLLSQFNTNNTSVGELSTIFYDKSNDAFVVVSGNSLVSMLGDSVVEKKFTTAIINLTANNKEKIYLAADLGIDTTNGTQYGFETFLTEQNYDVEYFNILTSQIPEDADLVIIHCPMRDLTSEAVDRLDEYLDNNGNLMVFYDQYSSKETGGISSFPKLDAYINEWGIRREPYIVNEGNTSKIVGDDPTYFYADVNPEYAPTSLLAANNLTVLAINSYPLTVLDVIPGNAEVVPIMASSSASYIMNPENPNQKKIASYNLGICVNKYKNSDVISSLIVFGTGSMFDDSICSQINTNEDLIANTIASVTGNDAAITIRPKYTVDYSITMSQNTRIILMVLVAVVCPLVFLLTGLVIWLRRRHL